MSQWVDRTRNHRIWGLLKSTGPDIDRALERESITPDAIDSLERLKTVLAICGKRLAATDSVLVLPNTIETLATHLAEMQANIRGFASAGDISLLNAANANADSALVQLPQIVGPETSEDLTTISQAAAEYRATLERHLKEVFDRYGTVAEKIANSEAKLAAIEASITTEQQRLSTILSEQQSQFSAVQDKRATNFSASLNEQATKFTAAFTEFQTQFTTAQNTRETTFADFQRTSSDKVASLIAAAETQLAKNDEHYVEVLAATSKNYEDRLGELQKGYADKAGEILALIQKNKKDVEGLVGVIGNLGVTSGYQKTANSAKRMMYFWQSMTSLSLVGLISVAILTAFPSLGEKLLGQDFNHRTSMTATVQADKDSVATKAEGKTGMSMPSESTADMLFYQGLATRIFLALTFGIFAGYAGRQASHFMGIERKNRKLALELEALGPFIEPLSTDERSKFRIQVGERSFGVPENESDKHKGDDPVSAFDLFRSKEIREFIVDLYNKAKKGQS